MIELRWLSESGSEQLQYRHRVQVDPYGSIGWSDWQDVPVVEGDVKSE